MCDSIILFYYSDYSSYWTIYSRFYYLIILLLSASDQFWLAKCQLQVWQSVKWRFIFAFGLSPNDLTSKYTNQYCLVSSTWERPVEYTCSNLLALYERICLQRLQNFLHTWKRNSCLGREFFHLLVIIHIFLG